MIRDDVVAFARSLAGLSADPARPAIRETYRALVAPGESGARANEIERMSGCALTCRGILRRFVQHPLLERPYRTGDAVADLVAIARAAGALRPPSVTPREGDMLIVGGGADGGGPEHAWTTLFAVESPYVDGGLLVTGLDGGQRAGGYQAIALRDHHLLDGRDVTTTGARLVRWVLDVEVIIERFGRDP